MGETIDLKKLDIDELEEIVSWFAKTGQKENVDIMNEYIQQRLYERIKGAEVEDDTSEYITDSSEESSSEEDDCVDELNIKVCIDEDGFYYMM